MMEKKGIRIAVIDLNNGSPNQGMRGILDILSKYEKDKGLTLSVEVFDLRAKNEIPDTAFDIYISSGGPGSPLESGDEAWEHSFFKLLDDLEQHNSKHEDKKHAFLICHSFQLACLKYQLGTVTKRKSNAFGIFPVTLTATGEEDAVFSGLPNPFYAVDSRDWQVIDPEEEIAAIYGTEILAIEKERKHIDLERCIMSVRFSNEIIGTQFHPEADPAGMLAYLLEEEKKTTIIAVHGEEKYNTMLQSLEDPEKIRLTQSLILPNFLDQAIHSI